MVTTKKAVAAAQPGWHADPRCQGLALWVKPNGHRVFVLDYRINGRQRRMTLGRAETLPADEAVKLARKHRVAIDSGRDPLADRETARRAEEANITLTTFFERYIDEYAKVEKKPRSVADDRWLFEAVIKGLIGRLRVPDLDQADVARLHRKLTAAGVTGKPAPILANRAVSLLSRMMTLAEQWKLRPMNSNPCKFVARNREQKRHRFLSSEQLVALGKALAESERAEPGSEEHELPVMVAVIRFALFTGMRKGEVLNLEWESVNLELGALDLPDSKTGRKLITLNAPARQLLAALPRVSKFVFPGRSEGKPLVGIGRAWSRIRTRAGLQGVRVHDLRHSFGSTAAGLGASLPVIGALLGHTVPSTTQRYAGLADDPRRAAAEAVGKQLDALLSPKKARNAAVPMQRKRRAR